MTRTRPDIPRAKRAGLDVDLVETCRRGPGALDPDDHYRLKTYGVCAQRHDDLFMVRMRVPAGRLSPEQLVAVLEASRRWGHCWVHFTTRQNIELHSVRLEDVPAIRDVLEPAGLFGRSACGHTVRNVMACPEADTSVEEPFDVTPDAVRLSRLLVERSSELNVALPSRINIVLGGCPSCGLDALTNDIGLIACVRDGEAGYQLWAGGSIGSSPRLSTLLRPFVSRHEVWPAVWTIIEWFCNEGDIDQVAKGRLKFLIDSKGEDAFRAAFSRRFAALREESQEPLPPVDLPGHEPRDLALARAPARGWRPGITPERRPGLASLTIRAPLGDLLADELEAIGRLSPDGSLVLTRDQNILLRHVPVEQVPAVTGVLGDMGLGPDGARGAIDVRACPGISFCSLAITGSQPVALEIERRLNGRPDLPRDASIAVSGCPNSCTKHQTADIGLAGGKVKVGKKVGLGYQLFLGADLCAGQVGEAVLRLLDEEVVDAVVAALELWVTLRRPSELAGATFRRIGLDVVASALALRLRDDAQAVGTDAVGPQGEPVMGQVPV